jgi:hypothetical protein
MVHGWSVIVTCAMISFACVQPNADLERHITRPQFPNERKLDRTRGRNTIACTRENREATVALPARSDDLAAVLLNQLFNDGIVADQGHSH